MPHDYKKLVIVLLSVSMSTQSNILTMTAPGEKISAGSGVQPGTVVGSPIADTTAATVQEEQPTPIHFPNSFHPKKLRFTTSNISVKRSNVRKMKNGIDPERLVFPSELINNCDGLLRKYSDTNIHIFHVRRKYSLGSAVEEVYPFVVWTWLNKLKWPLIWLFNGSSSLLVRHNSATQSREAVLSLPSERCELFYRKHPYGTVIEGRSGDYLFEITCHDPEAAKLIIEGTSTIGHNPKPITLTLRPSEAAVQ